MLTTKTTISKEIQEERKENVKKCKHIYLTSNPINKLMILFQNTKENKRGTRTLTQFVLLLY